MSAATWSYLPLPWPGAKYGPEGDGFDSIDVYAMRVSTNGLVEVVDGSGRWHRVRGDKDRDGRKLVVWTTTAYVHNGDL